MFLVKCLLGIIWIPMRVCFDECVEDHQQFAHASDDDELERFSLGFQALGERSDDRIATSCCQGGHVQDAADRGSAAPDGAFALKASTVSIERCQADQRGDFLSVEKTEFREFRQQRCDGDRSDTGSRLDDRALVFPFVIGFEQREDLLFNAFDLFVQQIDDLLHAFADGFGCERFPPAFLGGSQVDELTSACDELGEFLLFFMGIGKSSRSNVLPEPGDDLRIESIGLGQNAEASGEVAHLTRIDDSYEMIGVCKFSNNASLIPAGGFHNDQATSHVRQLRTQLLQPRSVVGNRELLSFGKNTNVERVLGDVDADKRCDRTVHGFVPVLQMRARCNVTSRLALAAVRAHSKRPVTILLCDCLGRPRRDRSATGRPGKACFATLRSLSQGSLHYIICF